MFFSGLPFQRHQKHHRVALHPPHPLSDHTVFRQCCAAAGLEVPGTVSRGIKGASIPLGLLEPGVPNPFKLSRASHDATSGFVAS